MVKEFRNNYAFLSNMYFCDVTYEGAAYICAEAAFQAAKTLSLKERVPFEKMAGPEAKKAGSRNGGYISTLRFDWEQRKNKIMLDILRSKFSNPDLKDKLIATGDEELVEGNIWHDNYYGNCSCGKCRNIPGQNHLGKILMSVRRELNA